MTYPEAIKFLSDLQVFGARFGLETSFKLAALWGNPQQKLRFIHVAGTNGKGSTCAFLASIYQQTGLKVGMYTSPHLVRFGERIQINGSPIPENEVARLTAEFRDLAGNLDQAPTFFEAVTLIALRYFCDQECDLVIWETGLGGRLDATNIVTPIASVITTIDYDHEKWLGNSLAEIAGEKAGIVKLRVPVVCGVLPLEARNVLFETAQKNQTSLIETADADGDLAGSVELKLKGRHQLANAALAVATVRAVQNLIPCSEKQMVEGLERTTWPGRIQIIKKGTQTFILDGAHNPAGCRALVETIRSIFPKERITLIIGMLSDKNMQAFCQNFDGLTRRVIVTKVSSARSAEPEELSNYFEKRQTIAVHNLKQGVIEAGTDSPVVITGSLYLIGEALQLIEGSPNFADEKPLNDWIPTGNFSGRKI